MNVRWITPLLGTAPATLVKDVEDIYVIDVRDLLDKAGNPVSEMSRKIKEGVDSLAQGRRTVICCDYGMSRSNAVATGVLSSFEKITFTEALRRVQVATGETEIKLEPLNAVRDALNINVEKHQANNQRTILVTGGSGFVGRALITSLGSDYRVIAPTKECLDVSLGSTQISLLADDENVDCIVHLANPRIYSTNVAFGQTLTMLRNVLDVCLMREIRLIYPSCWEVYSGYVGELSVDESTPLMPRGLLGETKYLAEIIIEHMRRTQGLKCTILRSSFLYGLGNDRPKFIYNFIEKAKRSENITTHRYINGDPSLDLMHVDDLISALNAVIRSEYIGNLNLGSGSLTSTRAIAEMIVEYYSGNSKIEQILINTSFPSIAMDTSTAYKALGWKPNITLSKGLESILAESNLRES